LLREIDMVKNLRVHGQVQGVGFRYHFSGKARRLSLTGWVRNRRDGSVEAMIEGSEDALEAMIAWARAGPPAASVERVDVSEGSGHYSGFESRHTE
jgi:acylphosphatase